MKENATSTEQGEKRDTASARCPVAILLSVPQPDSTSGETKLKVEVLSPAT